MKQNPINAYFSPPKNMKRCHKYHFLYRQLIVRKVMPHMMIKYTNYPGLWLVQAISEARMSIYSTQGLYSKRRTLFRSDYFIDNCRLSKMGHNRTFFK